MYQLKKKKKNKSFLRKHTTLKVNIFFLMFKNLIISFKARGKVELNLKFDYLLNVSHKHMRQSACWISIGACLE